jgi:succinate-semialdehyde dehydrogenase/glutarate-semialdehyde dehydrogenase
MDVVNPHTGETVESYEEADETTVESALSEATSRFETWRERPMADRCQLLEAAAEELRSNVEEYAGTMTREMGKPITEARSEVEKCAWVCDHYAEHARRYLQDEALAGPADAETAAVYEPLGPVLAIMPWNFPFWQVFRFAAPALAAGNVGLLKHASNVPGSALAIESVFERAGFPGGTFRTLLVGSDEIDDIIADERVRAATLTGSTPAGRAVASTAGEQLKPTVLELGGSDPFVVLDDADIERAAAVGAVARTINSGQSCIAAKRFVVHEDVYDEFLDAFLAELEAMTVGDPTDEATDVGPQARADLMQDLHQQVESSVEMGATVALGGEPLDRDGAYYPPTVLTDVPPEAPASCEELFGPAAAVFSVASEEAAIETANDTEFGLGASVWTEDLGRGRRLAREIAAGAVFVNELVKSDPRVPFGGIKESGYGRELAADGIRSFVNKKTVWVQH